MPAISSWLLSIAGIVILGVLAELILPEGQINKYTKVIFSFVILLVIIMPLPNLIGKEFDISQYFNSSSSVQEDYLYQLNIDKLEELNTSLEKDLEKAGLEKVEISINANVLCENLEIFGVYVDLCELEYDENFDNKNISKAKEKIEDIIKNYSLLKDVEVTYNEQT